MTNGEAKNLRFTFLVVAVSSTGDENKKWEDSQENRDGVRSPKSRTTYVTRGSYDGGIKT